MELDDLKPLWQQSAEIKPSNTDIMELIQHKSYGPVAALKREFRKQIMVMLVLPVLLLLTNAADVSKPLTSILFWSYVLFCMGVAVFAYGNIRIVRKMEGMDGIVRANLEQQVTLLETRLRWKIIGLRLALLFFIALTEIEPYFQHYRMLDKWHELSPVIRYGAYAALLLLQYVASRAVIQRKFGRHIAYLKRLTQELQH